MYCGRWHPLIAKTILERVVLRDRRIKKTALGFEIYGKKRLYGNEHSCREQEEGDDESGVA
jgi:hypothetical protein